MGVDPVSIGFGLAGLALNAYSSGKQRKAEKKAFAAQQAGLREQRKADELRQARERRDVIREARIRRATAIQAAASQGAGDSSAAAGGAGSITSQMGSNLSFLDSLAGYNKATTSYNYMSNKYASEAQTYGAYANLGGTVFQASGGFGTLFDGIGGGAADTSTAPSASTQPTFKPSSTFRYND